MSNNAQLQGFDDRILSLYARGMSPRDIQAHFTEVYGVEVSPPLDALVVRSRVSGSVQNKAVYLALGINTEGEKELMGLWMAQTEGAKFWLSVMNELKNCGL